MVASSFEPVLYAIKIPLMSRRFFKILSMLNSDNFERVFSISLYRKNENTRATTGYIIHETTTSANDRKFTSAPRATPEPIKLPIIT